MGRDKRNEKNAGRFVMLPHRVMDHPTWAALSSSARCVHLSLIRRFKGANNGRIYLPTREAAKALGISRNTAAKALRELEETGFIVETKGAHLGFDGQGKASTWRLTHLPTDGQESTFEFEKKQNPGTKTVHPWHKNRAMSKVQIEDEMQEVAQKPCHISADEWPKNRANLISSHRHGSESEAQTSEKLHFSKGASGIILHASKVFTAKATNSVFGGEAMPLSETKNSALARAAKG